MASAGMHQGNPTIENRLLQFPEVRKLQKGDSEASFDKSHDQRLSVTESTNHSSSCSLL